MAYMRIGIFSAARDGSTLLSRLLDGTPAAVVHPMEMKAFVALLSPEQRSRCAAGGEPPEGEIPAELVESHLTHMVAELRSHYGPQLHEGSGLADGDAPFVAPGTYRFAAALDLILREFERLEGRRDNFVFKTTEVAGKQAYMTALPDLRAIHIVRDPHSNYGSTKRTVLQRPGFLMWYGSGDILSTFVQRWRTHVTLALDGVAAAPDRNIIVRYEDVCRNPAGEIARICAWLDIEQPPRPDVQTVFGLVPDELPVNASRGDIRTPARVQANMATTFRYDNHVGERERHTIDMCLGELAGWVGYEGRRSSRARRLVMAGWWLPPAPWELRLARSRSFGFHELVTRRRFALRELVGRS